jgi:hypothetical protein
VQPTEDDLPQPEGPARLPEPIAPFLGADNLDPAALAIRSDIDALAGSPTDEVEDHVKRIGTAIVLLAPELANLRTPLSSLSARELESLQAQAETCHQLLSELCAAFEEAKNEFTPIPGSTSAEDLKQPIRDFDNWAGELFVEFTKNCEEFQSARSQIGEIASRECAVVQPQSRRIVADTKVAKAVTELQIRYEAAQRVKAFQTDIGGRGKLVNPPPRVSVTARHVSQAMHALLAEMPGQSTYRCLNLDALRAPEELFVTGKPRGRHPETTGPGQQTLRFEPAVELTKKGRELLGNYYARKYNADIVFSMAPIEDERELDSEFFERSRQKTGDVVRSALYRGHGENAHGTLLVYVREGAREGAREALIVFNSSADESDLNTGIELANDAARLTPGDKPIEVFQHVRAIQKDWLSCWVFAMKTAVTLTGHERDASGSFNDFLVPDLLARLQARRLTTPALQGASPVWALPEVTRVSQDLASILADAGGELDSLMTASKPGVTLRDFLEKYTYTLRDGTQQLDYMRQKGHRAAENAEIQAWSQQIGEQLGEEVWTTERQSEFAAQIKTAIHGRRQFPVEHNIATLPGLLADPAQLIWQGLAAHAQIVRELHGVNDMAQPALEHVEGRFQRPLDLLEKLEAQLKRCFEAYADATMPVAIEKSKVRILQELQGSKDMAAGMIQGSRDRHRNNLAVLTSLRSAGQSALAESIVGLAATSPGALNAEMMAVLSLMSTGDTGLAGQSASGLDLDHASDATLQALQAQLDMHAEALQLALERFHEVSDSMLPQRLDTPEEARISARDSNALNTRLNTITEDLFRRQLKVGQEQRRRASARSQGSIQSSRPHQG